MNQKARRLQALERAAATRRQPDLLSAAEMAEIERLPEDQAWRRFTALLAARLPAEMFDHLALVYGDPQR